MIEARLILPDRRELKVFLRPRQYRKLTAKIDNLSFWEKVKLLFLAKQ